MGHVLSSLADQQTESFTIHVQPNHAPWSPAGCHILLQNAVWQDPDGAYMVLTFNGSQPATPNAWSHDA